MDIANVGVNCKLHHAHGAIQSVVCCQDPTLKLLVILLYIIIICF